ncbi:MAG: hypothetical protein R3F37_22255 [Candidatus Competibacteraceae bacterium]
MTGATSITISFFFDPNNGLDGNDDLIAEYSADGGSSWTTLETLDGGSPDNTTYVNNTIAWDPADNTIILRFRAEDDIESGEEGRFDDVDISYTVPTVATGTFASNNPPNFAAGCSINTGETLTLTFDVTVDNPSLLAASMN